MEMIHISAHLENLTHAEVSMLWTGKIVFCDFEYKFPWWSALKFLNFRIRVASFWAKSAKDIFISKVTMYSLHHWRCFGFLKKKNLLSPFVFWCDSVLMLISSAGDRKQSSSQGRTEATEGDVTLWFLSALFYESAQSRVALNSLINWLYKRNISVWRSWNDLSFYFVLILFYCIAFWESLVQDVQGSIFRI